MVSLKKLFWATWKLNFLVKKSNVFKFSHINVFCRQKFCPEIVLN